MDLRGYFRKIRNIEEEIAEPYVVVVSRETPDGGKPGVKTEVPRGLAARLIVEDQATLASAEETAEFKAEMERRRAEIAETEALLYQVPRAVRSLRSQGKRQ
jgi:hypothetical protein